jgi:hypothetical protein
MVSHKCEHSKKIKVAQSGFSHRLAGDTVSSYRKLPPRAVGQAGDCRSLLARFSGPIW